MNDRHTVPGLERLGCLPFSVVLLFILARNQGEMLLPWEGRPNWVGWCSFWQVSYPSLSGRILGQRKGSIQGIKAVF